MPASFTIRPFRFTQADYEAVIRIWNAVWPNLTGFQDRMQQEDICRDANLPLSRLLVEMDGNKVAYGDMRKLSREGVLSNYYFSIHVLPEYRNQGIGGMLYENLLSLIDEDCDKTLFTDTYDTFVDSVRFLEARGFELFMRYPLSILDVTQFDFKSYVDLQKTVNQKGIHILPVSELSQSDLNWREKLWKLDDQIQRDAPAPTTHTSLSFEEFVTKKIESNWFRPELWMIALDGDKWVGESALEPVSKERYWTHITGVVKNYRRSGIATALKLSIIQQVCKNGGKYIQTSNEENNPMYRINQRLGFQPEPTEIHYRKALS